MINKKCVICKEKFEVPKCYKKRRCCKRRCRDKYLSGKNNPAYKKKIKKMCPICKINFQVRPWQKDRICIKRKCADIWRSKMYRGKTNKNFKNIDIVEIIKFIENVFKYEGRIIKNTMRNKFTHKNKYKPCGLVKLDKTLRLNNLTLDELANFEQPFRNVVTIGQNEKEILDQIEQETKSEIIRQYNINRYYVDGYDLRNNIVYEVDESHHFINSGEFRNNDIIRQRRIENILGCNFIRIQDV